QIAVNSIELKRGDTMLLCSDGLSGKVSAAEMATIIRKNGSLEESAKELIELAKQRGGEDNITVILARFDGEGLKPKAQETLTRSINVLSRFDPTKEATAKSKLLTRPALFADWESIDMVYYYAHNEEQLQRLSQMGEFGQFVVCRRGDILTVSADPYPDTLYCLVSGRYILEVETTDGRKHNLAMLVSPMDR